MTDWSDKKPFGLLGALRGLSDKPTSSPVVDALTGRLPPQNPFGLTLGSLPSALPPPRKGLVDFVAALAPPTPSAARKSLSDLLAGSTPTPNNPFAGLTGALPLTPAQTPSMRNALADLAAPNFGALSPPLPVKAPPRPAPVPIKRKGFFSFHFDDLMRVNNVRNAWKIAHPDRRFMRNFHDRSLWESRKLEGDEALKRLIREGMEHSSAVCVLVGTWTWSRRWVKYEIARSVIDRRGLLAVHINGLKHHQRRVPDAPGFNPLRLMGVFKHPNGQLYLYEKQGVVVDRLTGATEWQWRPYADYKLAVPLPQYMTEPSVNHVVPLSAYADEYDYVAEMGHRNLGLWIDRAAKRAGR